jgi:hypothetical protein
MDLSQYVGKHVEVTLYRKHKYKQYHGRLTDIGMNEICLVNDGKSRWILRPCHYKDTIREIDHMKVIEGDKL